MRIRRFIKSIMFVALLVLTLAGLQHFFLVGPFTSDEKVGRDNHASFRAQESNTLDVVYVGASNVYSFWQAPLAWDSYGLASHSYANWSMPPAAIRYIIEECRKTQPNALYVVNVNNFRDEGNSKLKHCHWSTDDLPLTPSKLKLIQALCEQNGFSFDEAIELVFPLLGFHSTWSDLQSEDFAPNYADVGGAATNAMHFTTRDVSVAFKTFAEIKGNLDEYGPFEEDALVHDSLDDLIAYCKQEDVSILFVSQPQANTDPQIVYNLAKLCEIIEDAGMDIVDLSDPAVMGLDPCTDFRDVLHTNSHGSIKYTDYLARYITDTYVIPDRRNDTRYAEWFETASRYKKYLMTRNIRDFEFDLPTYRTDLRAYDLSAKNMHLFVRLKWSPAAEADEYLVYRIKVKKIDDPSVSEEELDEYAWKCIAHLDPSAVSYDDLEACEHMPLVAVGTSHDEGTTSTDDTEMVQYDYSVIPVLHREDGDVYGSYYVTRATVNLVEPIIEEEEV